MTDSRSLDQLYVNSLVYRILMFWSITENNESIYYQIRKPTRRKLTRILKKLNSCIREIGKKYKLEIAGAEN